jgi:uncharacterized membrane protein
MTEMTASIPTLRSSTRPAPRKTTTASQWLPPVGLIALSLIPVLAGAFRLNELMSSPEITAENARFVASPIPVTVHIVSVTVYSLLGALQFVPLLRRGRQNWHRIAGRILIPAGAFVALTGLWMNFFYPRPPGDGESLVVVRLIVGLAMLASIVLAVLAIRRRDFSSHGAWMTRGYAIALSAGTQVFTMLPWVVIFGTIGAADELPRTVLMTAGWVINLAAAEYIIHRRPGHRSNRTSAGWGSPERWMRSLREARWHREDNVRSAGLRCEVHGPSPRATSWWAADFAPSNAGLRVRYATAADLTD